MREGESGGEQLRMKHGEEDGHAIGRDKGESVGGCVSGVKEGSSREGLEKSSKVSFRDKVIGAEKSKAFALVGSLSGYGIATVTGKQGDSRPPSVSFTKEAKSCLAEPYKEAIVIKVLDKHYGYTALMHKLQIVWRIKGGFDLLDVGFGYFLVKFDIAADREKVILGGPWLIDGHYVAVKPWDVDFRPCKKSFGSMLEQAMLQIASAIGISVKVDLATKLAERGKYARACVQINLELPVIKHIIVEGVTYEVEYESLQLICATCARYGHDKSLCMEKESLEGNGNSFGDGKNNESPTLVPHNNHEIQKEAKSEARDLGENPRNLCEKLGVVKGKDVVTESLALHVPDGHVNEACMDDEEGWQQVLRNEKFTMGQSSGLKDQDEKQHKFDSRRVPRPNLHGDGGKSIGIRMGKREKHEIAPSPSRRTPARREISLRKRLGPSSLQNSPVDKNDGTTEKTLVDGSMAGAVSGGPKVAIIEDQSVPVLQDKQPIEGITLEVHFDNLIWRCSGIYGSPQFKKRVLLWDYLVAQSMVFQGLWIVLGDFNEVKFSHESKGCQFSHQRADMFATSLGDSGLFDLKTIGRQFSWYRRVKNYVDVEKKLDRVCINSSWVYIFPEAYAEVLNRLQSDHCPILVRCKGRPQPKGSRPFRFVAAWATHPGYRDIVNQSWWSGNRGIHGKLSEVQKNSLEFNSKCKKSSYGSKSPESSGLGSGIGIQDSFIFKLLREGSIIRFMAFFSRMEWETDPEVLSQEAESFYKSLFCHLDDVDLGCLGDVPLPSLNEEACNNLTAPVTMEEVRTAVFHMNSFKAPGPDGFQAFFFKEYWEIIGLDVWKMVKQAFSGVTLDPRMLETLLVLIPKVELPVSMKDFRPISLCNVVYKIITKVLVNRLRPHLAEIVGPLQGGFIPGRGTPDNIIIAQEVLHFMKKTKSKKGTLAFKIDLEKAYDRVDQRFLAHTLKSFGFPIPTLNSIMNCVTASSLSIFWNGSRLNGFTPSRGLRQGDPLSAYLFVLCMERLACFISHQVDLDLWEPVAISRGGPRISHLM
ncbi:uncharacterized protein LOC130949067 [Arachis stenosperma]|uniref:uncharacterized protein LOC130949067 n=1 Tax=Arachis stenosperma TaxID=217475 RepID=UPI0025AC434E|nr:uncharacterized protein LOC130949067 [Arachis stenosperma]